MKGWIVAAGLCFGALGVGACSGGSDGAAANGGDASTSDGAASGDASANEASTGDAGGGNEQDPNVYPASHAPIPQVDNLGGPVLDHAKLVTVTWTGDPVRDALRAFTHTLLGTQWWQKTIGGMGLGAGTNGGDYELANTLGGTVMTDDNFHTYITQQIQSGKLPRPDAETLYVFYLPSGATLDNAGRLTCRDNGGYHHWFIIDLGGPDAGADAGVNVLNVPYAIVPRCAGLTDLTIGASHEIAEAATDPAVNFNNTYYLMSNDAWIPTYGGQSLGGEVGDLCTFLETSESGYTIQRSWSNAAAKASKNPCQPASKPYFGAAVRTTPRTVGGLKVDGHLVVRRGESLDTPVDFFSEAPLPHDATLSVGAVSDGPGLGPLPSGVSAQLSRTQAHNGNGLVLTITATSSATTGDVHMAVRSKLDASDINDWPVILTVR